MAGIYLHIPFCRQACTYCNFHFTTSLRYKDDVVRALISEAEAETDYLQGETIHTIYFGGGTPSLLSAQELDALLSALNHHYPVAGEAEITLEANPDDISPESLHAWKSLGINRLSLGVQSFFEEELRWMNRAHTAGQALAGLELAAASFSNITMDLIYGSPQLTDEMWRENVDRATSLGLAHLSCYALTVEEKTALHKQIHLQKTPDVDSDKQARQFLLLMQWLREKGYEHYEVSNFARPGFRSRHNSSYWRGEKYLGLGPSAHSYNGVERRWNPANNRLYVSGMQENNPVREKELLTPAQRLNEYLMISLRTIEGIDLNLLEQEFGKKQRERVSLQLHKPAAQGLITVSETAASLTDEGMLLADGLAAELFEV